jgi:ABC-type Fe3+ transport system substrate-binding protein
MVDSGQVQLGLTDMTLFLRDKQKGAPVDRLPLTPMAHDVRGWYFPKGALHPNAGRLFAAWMVSPEGHALQQSAAGYELATPCSASPTAKYICDQKIDYIDYQTQKLDIMGYYEKLDSYIQMAADIIGVTPQ